MADLRLEHVYKVYPNGTRAVSDFTMEIKDKEFIVFVGPSGCGKSTTLRMIAGLEDISAGELYIGNDIVNDVEPKDRDIAMVFQNYALYPHMTVYENMAFGLKLRHVPNTEIHERVIWAAKVLDLTEYLDRKPKAMSGGQRQRVALGRAILRKPQVMLLDEPLSNLDAKLRSQMRSEIAKLHDQLKTTFIYVTHDQVEAMTLGTRVVVMKLGRIMQIDTPKNLYDYPNNLFVAGFIGTPQMNFFRSYLLKDGDNVHVTFRWSEETLDIPYSKLAKVKAKYLDGKCEVVFGIRCEHLSLDPEVVEKSKYLLNVRISHFEELGNETLIYADINKEGDGFTESSTRVIIKGTSNYGLVKGEFTKAAVNIDRIHMFDSITEETINSRIPQDNLIDGEVKSGKLLIDNLEYDLPKAIKLEDGKYNLLFPIEAIKLTNGKQNIVKVINSEDIEGKKVLSLGTSKQLLFTIDNEYSASTASLDIDFTQIEFSKDNQVVSKAISSYDKINSIFLNYETAKSFVGNKYEDFLNRRVEAVKEKYEGLINELKSNYEANIASASHIDSEVVIEKNKPLIADKKQILNSSLTKLKEELKNNSKKKTLEHKEMVKKISQEVNEMYTKIYNDEIGAFESFKKINKDKDSYRKRAAEIRVFKNNFSLEKKNELEKRLNLESLRYDSEINSLKNIYKRTVEGLKKDYEEFIKECDNEAYPVKNLTKAYNKELKELEKEYTHQTNLAKILFFFKTNDLVTLSSDQISNKMVQSLGVKVFTKEYLLEIPHDAYKIGDEGLVVKVVEGLDYGKKQYLHCEIDDGAGIKDLYIESSDMSLVGKDIKVLFDISKIHITEKSMDIKIY